MYLAIDAGNTNIVFALARNTDILHEWRLKTNRALNINALNDEVDKEIQECSLDLNDITACIIGSVVPAVDETLRHFCEEITGKPALFVNHKTIPIKVDVPDPAQAGADRIINTYAASRDYGAPAVVVDFGTATTFDILGAENAYKGGVIAPGVNLSMQALHNAAAKLPFVPIEKPDKAIGTNTVDAMQSGLFWGYVGLVEKILQKISEEQGKGAKIIATGGLANLFAPSINMVDSVDQGLTIRGLLYMLADKEKKE